jgi:monothiol glutaredoxin
LTNPGFGGNFQPLMNLFVKPGCPWCVEAVDWLEARGLAFREIDVFSEPGAFDRMREISGQSLAPTLEMPDGTVLADFDVGQLERFLKERAVL